MPSEKSRYLERNRGSAAPLALRELKECIPSLGVDRLTEILWVCAERDDVLRKTLMVAITIQFTGADLNKAKEAIDYALHFRDYVRYTESGHGLILEEIKTAVELVADQGHREFALKTAQYALERGQAVAENFEDDWDWSNSLESLINWAKKMENGS